MEDTKALLISVNIARKDANKFYSKRTLFGRELADTGNRINPCIFPVCGGALMCMVYGHKDGQVEIVALKPADLGRVVSTGLVTCDFEFVVKCFHAWRGKKVSVLLLENEDTLVIGDYSRLSKKYTGLDFCFKMEKLDVDKAFVFNAELRKRLDMAERELCGHRHHTGDIGVTIIREDGEGNKRASSLGEMFAEFLKKGENDGAQAAEEDLKKADAKPGAEPADKEQPADSAPLVLEQLLADLRQELRTKRDREANETHLQEIRARLERVRQENVAAKTAEESKPVPKVIPSSDEHERELALAYLQGRASLAWERLQTSENS
jgi:hypothetical protein